MSWVRSERWTEDLTLDLDPGEMLLLLVYAQRGEIAMEGEKTERTLS